MDKDLDSVICHRFGHFKVVGPKKVSFPCFRCAFWCLTFIDSFFTIFNFVLNGFVVSD